MRNEVAPVALQESVVELPAVIVLGEAEKEEMVGAEVVAEVVCEATQVPFKGTELGEQVVVTGFTVTVAVAVTEPAELVAVKV